MQIFEIILLITLLISSGSIFIKPVNRRSILVYFPFFSIFILLLHLLFEGIRWQMIPAYMLGFILVILSFLILRHPHNCTPYQDRKWLRIAGAVCSILLLITTTVLASILPVFDLPKTTGSFVVGTTTLMLEDPNRMELMTDDPKDYRRLMVRAWYPADTVPDSATRMRYMHPFEAQQFAMKYGLPDFMVSHLKHVKTYAFEELQISKREPDYPVLLFSHGYNVPPAIYAGLLTEIASHGYIIMAVNHPYQSVATVYPDGSKASFDYQYQSNVYEGVWETIEELEQQYWDAESDSAKIEVIRRISAVYPNTDMIRLWSKDYTFLIDQLEAINLNKEYPFSGRLGMEKIGAFGHSAGGATAGQLLLDDDRVKAGINLDGAQWGDVIDSKFVQPFMRIETVRDSSIFTPNDLIYHNGSEAVLYDLKVDTFGHSNFSDIPFLIPVQSVNEAGSVNPYYATELVTDFSIAFFDKYLRNDNVIDLSELKNEYPEVTLKIKSKARSVNFKKDFAN